MNVYLLSILFYRVQRQLDSNQRVSFDIDPWGKYLISGSQDGRFIFKSFFLMNYAPLRRDDILHLF